MGWSSGRISKPFLAAMLVIIAAASVGVFLRQTVTVSGEILIPPYNPRAYDYNFILPINVSEAGTEITVIWNSFVMLYEPRIVGWSAPSVMGLTTIDEASAYQSGQQESFETLASAVVDSPPLDTGFLSFDKSSGDIVRNSLGLPLHQIYLYPIYTFSLNESVESLFAYSLREQGVGCAYTFAKPGEYILFHRYPVEDAQLRAVLRNACDRFGPEIVTAVVVYLQAPDEPRVVYRRFQLHTAVFQGASWQVGISSHSYHLDNQSIVVPSRADITLAWEASASINMWLRPEKTDYRPSYRGRQGTVTCHPQPDTYYIVFYGPVKDFLDGGYIRYSVTFPRYSGVWVWQGTYPKDRWKGMGTISIYWSNEEVLRAQNPDWFSNVSFNP